MTDTLRPPPSARAEQVIDRYRDIPHRRRPAEYEPFRRRIRLINVNASCTVGELEDDCRFRVKRRHDPADGQYLRGRGVPAKGG
jgi:hypothetical protein